jgi:ankyrin repeat protein
LSAVVALLLERGANPTAADNNGQTPLHLAASSSAKGNQEAVAALLAKGADLKARDRRGSSPLHRVATPEMAKYLLEKGADYNAADAMGNTPLHNVVQNRIDIVPLLVAAGADVNRRNKSGDMPLHVALRPAGHMVAAALVQKTDLNARDSFGLTPVHLALLGGNRDARDVMMARNPTLDEVTQVFDAVATDDVTKLRAQLEAKPYLAYARLSDGSTPLHVAARWLAPATAALLLARSADPNARNAAAVAPIHLAMQRVGAERRPAVRAFVTQLLDKGADVNAIGGMNNAPLHMALYMEDKELIALLLDRHADPNIRGWRENAPLHMVVSEIHDDNLRQAVVEMLLAKDAFLDAPGTYDSSGDSPYGQTPLMLAISRLGYDGGRSLPLVRQFLEKGASLTAVDDAGNTALAIAVLKARKDAVLLLLEKNADVNARNLAGQTPLALALKGKRDEIAELLRAKGAKE